MSEPSQHDMEENEPSQVSPAQIPDPQTHELINCCGFETLNFGVFFYVAKANGNSELSQLE